MGSITRRDFINGTLMVAGSSLLSCRGTGDGVLSILEPSYYPPALTGLRGSHPGSNEHAHRQASSLAPDWGPTTELGEDYDLVVVGGGISGLAAAYFFQERYGQDTKILVLDNHDDFGGHAKRNEHTINGELRIGYGGSQTLVEPSNASEVVLGLFRGIGVEVERFESAYDRDFLERHDLRAVTYFNEAVFGEDKVVAHPYCNYPNYVEGLPSPTISHEEAAGQAPLSERGKEQLLRLLHGGVHAIDVSEDELDEYLRTHSYFDYLKETFGVDDPGVLRMARHSGLDWGGTGTDLMSIQAAKACGALGFAPVAVYDAEHPYIHHFPDGNAGVARALVKSLIPEVGPGNNAEALVLSRFDYSRLDQPTNAVRVRLGSTVVDVRHEGDPEGSGDVLIQYIHDDRAHRVRGKHVVMACYNMMIPHIVPDLPEGQAAALRQQTKSPLIYTTVGLKNWRAVRDLGMAVAMSPGNMHQAVLMDFPVSMGGYDFTRTPDDPCVLQMISCPYGETVGSPKEEQFEEARTRMLGLQFEDYEQEIRAHLGGMLPSGSFDFDRDVESITVNRWAHGYTSPGSQESVERGRQPFGRITVANCDSAPGSDAQLAIEMAARAVGELG